jgi:two-component system, sensor histidine kinase and response regulator
MDTLHKLLFVDDEERNLRMYTRIFSKNYDVLTKSSGLEALEIIPSYRPDIVLLDVMMPGIDGYEVCRRIRVDSRFRFTKIILVSGKAQLEERLKGYDVGADDYIVKPFDRDEIKAKVDVFLRLKRAEEVDQIKGDLITLFSHETKSPLSGIIGLTELLKEDKTLNPQARNCVELIHKSGLELLEFVRKTSFLCELKTGISLKKSSSSLASHLKIVLGKQNEVAHSKGVSFHLSTEADIVLSADWELLHRVFDYIFDNAIKFSPPETAVTIGTLIESGICRISIHNEGPSIDPYWIDNVFNEFAIRDVMHHQKGQGLSLAIAQKVIEHHGGTIEVDRLVETGATFTINLPLG